MPFPIFPLNGIIVDRIRLTTDKNRVSINRGIIIYYYYTIRVLKYDLVVGLRIFHLIILIRSPYCHVCSSSVTKVNVSCVQSDLVHAYDGLKSDVPCLKQIIVRNSSPSALYYDAMRPFEMFLKNYTIFTVQECKPTLKLLHADDTCVVI